MLPGHPSRWKWAVLVVGLALHLLLQLGPAWQTVATSKHGRDFASYYYAVQVAAEGQNPYETALLDRAAQAERTRKEVHPYFYPPPFLLAMTWALPFSLHTSYVGMLLLNEALLVGCLVVLVRAFAVAPWVVALLIASFTPIPDNAWMGQANLMALFPALVGLALAANPTGRRPIAGGVLVGIAAMFKMSPALFLLYWALRRQWRPVFAAMATAVGLSLLALPLVGLSHQLYFYREVLPGFAAGDYHGLSVPISLPANHSIPDLFNRLWPGASATRLSDAAQTASKVVTLLALTAWGVLFRRSSPGPALGALTLLMVVIPAYTYEHHLVFLLLPVAVAATRGNTAIFLILYFFLSWPLEWLRWTQKQVPALDTLLRESKFFAEVGLFFLLAWIGRAAAADPKLAQDSPVASS